MKEKANKKVQVSICQEDILNLNNAIERLIATETDNYQPLEILTIKEIIKQFESKIACKSCCPYYKPFDAKAPVYMHNCKNWLNNTEGCKLYSKE